MHELGLSEGLLATVVGVAGDRTVSRVRVSIGALQRVVPDSLEFGFRLVAEGTVCEAARLEIRALPVRVRCTACGVESRTDEEPVGCPACGAGAIEMLGGAEVLLDEVELEGTPPTVIRRAGLEVSEPPHEHEHGDEHDHGGSTSIRDLGGADPGMTGT